MRIGLISDTHIPEARAELWPQVYAAFEGVDAILHGGDIHDVALLDTFTAIAPTSVSYTHLTLPTTPYV